MWRSGSRYKESTIRTHVTSRMCRNAPKYHATKYDDFERVDYGTYRLVRTQARRDREPSDMPHRPPSRAELIIQAERMLLEAPQFRSLCRGRRYKLISVDARAGNLHVLFKSGRTRRLAVDDIIAILKELYIVRTMPRNYFRSPEKSLRVLGRSYWHAPGAALLAILPRLDSDVRVDRQCGLFLAS